MNRRTCFLGALVLAASVPGAFAASAEHTAQVKQAEARVARLDERLASLSPADRRAELLAARARTLADLSRRFLAADDPAAAQVQADVAERLAALAEKAARQ